MRFRHDVARVAVALLTGMTSSAARADETPLLVAGALFDSASPTVAPLLVLRVPTSSGGALSVSQLGWTSGLALDLLQDPHWRWTNTLAFTPVRAHLSHDVYDERGRELPSARFDDSSLRITSGEAWEARHVRIALHLLLQKEWLSFLPPEQAAGFAAPFVGVESSVTVEAIRAEVPLAERLDGVRASARVEVAAGDRRWLEGDLRVALGRRWGIGSVALEAGGFYVSLDHPVTNVNVGGSWDVLGPLALVGHPLGAFRASRVGAATARCDVDLSRHVTLGARQSLLVGASSVHDGLALILSASSWGVHLFAGWGSPDRAIFRGEWRRTTVFAGLTAALLFLP